MSSDVPGSGSECSRRALRLQISALCIATLGIVACEAAPEDTAVDPVPSSEITQPVPGSDPSAAVGNAPAENPEDRAGEATPNREGAPTEVPLAPGASGPP